MTNIQVPAPIEEKIQKEYPIPNDPHLVSSIWLNKNLQQAARWMYGLAWQWIPVEENTVFTEQSFIVIEKGSGWVGEVWGFKNRTYRATDVHCSDPVVLSHYISYSSIPQPPQQ